MWTQFTILTFGLAIVAVLAMPSQPEDKKQHLLNSTFANKDCIINADCPETRACKNSTCINPCNLWCAEDSICEVSNHTMTKCSCPEGKIGDPLDGCKEVGEEGAYDPCDQGIFRHGKASCSEIRGHVICSCQPNNTYKGPITNEPEGLLGPENSTSCVCGLNAYCEKGKCVCKPHLFGNPYEGCRPECIVNSECRPTHACVNQKCVDPCIGACGKNAYCQVINHLPSCTCSPGTTGNPFNGCEAGGEIEDDYEIEVCSPSPCGPYSICSVLNHQVVCTCKLGYIGSPPNCRPGCLLSNDCPADTACIYQKCRDPCSGVCGHNSECKVFNHIPMCICPLGMTGDPFVNCYAMQELIALPPVPPCSPSPCGEYSQCSEREGYAVCQCLQGYAGSPPKCQPKCISNSECPDDLACNDEYCSDPCIGLCGYNAYCIASNHSATCACPPVLTGDPYVHCYDENREATSRPSNRPSTCTMNSECSDNEACINEKCVDPCPGVCGTNAVCKVINHYASCSCSPYMTGDPFIACTNIKKTSKDSSKINNEKHEA